jgi:hypothetical protein
MCTVTLLSWAGRVRLAVNRDELLSRPAALPPEVRSFGPHRAILPIDPASGGTWVAVNDAGLAMTVLNVTASSDREQAASPKSRGAVLPALLSAGTLSVAVERALRFDAGDFAPFRLVIADQEELAELRSSGARLCIARRSALTVPFLFTSSGLGDGLVEGPRSKLFAEHIARADDLVAAQDAFHRHSWPDYPHLSVCMRRPDARTVSHTVVTLSLDRVSLTYHPDATDQRTGVFALSLNRRPILGRSGFPA